MEMYGFNNKKKKKRFWLIPVCIVAAILVCIFVLGIVVNVTNADRQTISSAVEENTQLKQQIDDLTTENAKLQGQIDDLNAQLEARPTVQPTDEPTASISPSPQASTKADTPRNN